MKLKEIVTEYRHINSISQRELARRCDLSHGTIYLIEKGFNPQTEKEIQLDLDTYKKLADGMGITMQELFERIDDSEVVLNPASEDQKLLAAYNKADPAIQSAIRKLLDI